MTSPGIHTKKFLIYNTTRRAGILPGYYYWYDKKWNNLKNIIEKSGVPTSRGNAGDVFVDLSTRDVYFHNGTIWVTKIINEEDLTLVKYNAVLGLLLFKNGTETDDYIDLSKLATQFGKPSCISMNVLRKTVNFIDDKGVFAILDLKY